MAKRAVRKAEAVVDSEESEFKVGAVASYYDNGWRAGVIEEVEVDDDGDLLLGIRPIGLNKRKVYHKSHDTKLEKKIPKRVLPPA